MAPETSTRDDLPSGILSLILREATRVIGTNPDKKIIIYGAGVRGVVFYDALKQLGYKALYFVDAKADKTHFTDCCGLPVHDPMNIMYEDPDDILVVVAARSNAEQFNILNGLGLEYGVNYNSVFDAGLDNASCHVPCYDVLDFFLGYTRVTETPGFEVLSHKNGWTGQFDLKIMILGGSTSDPEVMDPMSWDDAELRKQHFGSWPRYLHEFLVNAGISHRIFNGGIGGYSSAQELLKFLRDSPCVKPDLVIVLNGINDGCAKYWHDGKYPKYHSHFASIESALRPLMAEKETGSVFKSVSYGLMSKNSRVEDWFENQRAIYALCKEFGIEFVSFLQPFGVHDPVFLSSCDVEFRTSWFLHNFFESLGALIVEYATHEKLNLQNMLAVYAPYVFSKESCDNGHFSFKFQKMEDFYAAASAISKENDFIVSIVDTFYGIPDAIYDTVHCTDKGNRLLAMRIYRELTSRGILERALTQASYGRNLV